MSRGNERNPTSRVGAQDRHGAALALEDVTVSYPDGTAPVSGVDLTLAPGEIVALLGASGSGKSTLLRGVAGLEHVSAGRILLDGEDVTGLPTHRRGVGMVFQDGQLFPHRSVARNVAYGLESAKVPRGERTERVAEMLELVDLAAFGDRPVQNLSGGQAQRVALARSLAPSPRVMLLDEPLSALDRDLRERLAAQIRQILKATGTTAVHVTHDREEASTLADRVVRLHDDGSLTQV